MSKRIVGILLIALLAVGLVAWGNALTPLVQLSDAVQPLYFDGTLQLIFWDTDSGEWESDPLQAKELEHQFLCTASAVETDDGIGWLTARHCIDANEDEVTLLGIPLWKETIEKDAFYINDQPVKVAAEWDMWALLQGGNATQSIPWPQSAPQVEIGELFYSISYAEGSYDYTNTTELYKFFTKGRVEALAPSGTNIIASLDAVPGNSGAPAFVERDGELILVGTIEATFSSGKTRVELLGQPPSPEEQSTETPSPAPTSPSQAPKSHWGNWDHFPDWLQQAWLEVWQANSKWTSEGLKCFFGNCYWGLRFETGLIIYIDSETWLAFPLRVQDIAWGDYTLYGANWDGQQWREDR